MNCVVLFVIVVAIVTVLDLYENIPKFYARKLAHMFCGMIILLFDMSIHEEKISTYLCADSCVNQNSYCVYFIYIIAVTSVLRFGAYADKGIIIYNIIVSLFFFFKLRLYVLTPIFFADPMAAIVGRNFPTYSIYKKKTLQGTLTCFFVSLISLYYVGNYLHILILSLSLCLMELFGGTFDNFLMCFPLFIYMMFFNV
ncbi:hypothetical protein MKS88_000478 [Plasmodium brasilianum]|uniref:Uncharacterized protein n=1 Tax=Plasmodium brasilianum TaxID=5824 RepID=A0ACB9YFB6_PLABR|nr:hypothetical protein MKS88_000478 [Plasmodium brasilianum]